MENGVYMFSTLTYFFFFFFYSFAVVSHFFIFPFVNFVKKKEEKRKTLIELNCFQKKEGKMPRTLIADYVIVGGGTGGAVAAKLLSDRDKKTGKFKKSVIVLENGRNDTADEAIRNPAFAGQMNGTLFSAYLYNCMTTTWGAMVRKEPPLVTAHCTEFSTAASEQSGSEQYTNGRTLGGGSSINGMLYVRNSSAEWEEWHKASGYLPIWSPVQVFHRFKELETYVGQTDPTPPPTTRGDKGPFRVQQIPDSTTVDDVIVNALSVANNIPITVDYNSGFGPVFCAYKAQQFARRANGDRESSATAFLGEDVMTYDGKGVDGRRLLVLFRILANRLIWADEDDCNNEEEKENSKRSKSKKKKAIGVLATDSVNSDQLRIIARESVIVAAGNNSTAFLQRSGVLSSPEFARCLGIPLAIESPQSGLNLKNHYLLPISFTSPSVSRRGFAYLPAIGEGYNPALRTWRIQLTSTASGPQTLLSGIIGNLEELSSGLVRIQSRDPSDVPLVDTNVFGDPRDLQEWFLAIRTYLKNTRDQLHAVDPAYDYFRPSLEVIDSDVLLRDYIFDNLIPTHHFSSTNRIGETIQTGVVDGRLKVHGTRNVYVADVSVAPNPDGNTAAPALMAGWTVAKLLRNELFLIKDQDEQVHQAAPSTIAVTVQTRSGAKKENSEKKVGKQENPEKGVKKVGKPWDRRLQSIVIRNPGGVTSKRIFQQLDKSCKDCLKVFADHAPDSESSDEDNYSDSVYEDVYRKMMVRGNKPFSDNDEDGINEDDSNSSSSSDDEDRYNVDVSDDNDEESSGSSGSSSDQSETSSESDDE